MSSPPAQTIPSFYRIFFTTLDPLFSLTGGVLGHSLAPTQILSSYTATPTSPPATETVVLLDTMVGVYACLSFLHAVLLRARPADVTVWRALQFGTLFVDLGLFEGVMRALAREGRLAPADWRAEDWFNVAFVAVWAVIRAAFLLGVGMGGKGGKSA